MMIVKSLVSLLESERGILFSHLNLLGHENSLFMVYDFLIFRMKKERVGVRISLLILRKRLGGASLRRGGQDCCIINFAKHKLEISFGTSERMQKVATFAQH
jgi:hypothetical protein